jgi:lysophospholipase
MSFVLVPGNDVPAGAEEHWLEARKGVRIRMMTAPALGQPRGSCLVAPGRTEFIEKYFEVARELLGRGFCVFCIDWRGQGLSSRELSDPLKGHFNSFDDAVGDLAAGLAQLADKLPRPYMLLAHSMGGGITLRALQKGKLTVEGAAFSSPMWGIKKLTGPVKMMASALVGVGAGGAFAPGVTKTWEREAFEGNTVTNDEGRHQRCQDLIAADTRLALAGPTYGWLAAAAQAFADFRKPGALKHLTMPIVVASAGEELLVDNKAHDEIAALLPNCRHIQIEHAKHELLMEKDAVRAKFWAAFDEVADKAAPRGA